MPDLVDTSSNASIKPGLHQALIAKASTDQQNGLRSLFKQQTNRVEQFSHGYKDFYLDLSKTHITQELVELYTSFAREIDFYQRRHDLFTGVKINVTEDRAVLHTLLRDPSNQGIKTVDPAQLQQAEQSRRQFVEQYRAIQQQLTDRNSLVKDIIHVGIGGSSLGTQLLFEALKELSDTTSIHFIANIDAHQLVAVLDQCDVDSTLVIGISKTFTTTETLQNLRSIGDWYRSKGKQNYFDSVYAVTASPENASRFGISTENTVVFPQWVGGRYSVWSSVSLSAMLVLGQEKFDEFLAGAASLDKYFLKTPVEKNICYLTAMMDHYYHNYWSADSRAIFAYDYRLRSLVNYLQQLETESNGKDRQINGFKVDQRTAPVVWGGVGTEVQHSVFQMLHQGTSIIPSEFILIAQPDHHLNDHHTELLANGLAQAAALMAGQNLDTVKRYYAGQNLSELALQSKVFSGNRPSTTILLKKLTARSLGALLAFYEHRIFCGGLLSNINSFDQMGVELGKRLASQLKPILDEKSTDDFSEHSSEFDTSTERLVAEIQKMNG